MKNENDLLPAAAVSRPPCEACAQLVRTCKLPQHEKYSLCAGLILNSMEESIGLIAPRGRARTEKALIAILAYYFPQGATAVATPQAKENA